MGERAVEALPAAEVKILRLSPESRRCPAQLLEGGFWKPRKASRAAAHSASPPRGVRQGGNCDDKTEDLV